MSQSGEQSLAETHICRWDWCTLTFATEAQLTHHVVYNHVRRLIPVRRGDISVLRRAEEGIGQSLSMISRMSGVSAELVVEGDTTQNVSKEGMLTTFENSSYSNSWQSLWSTLLSQPCTFNSCLPDLPFSQPVEHTSSLPSPPNSSPSSLSPEPQEVRGHTTIKLPDPETDSQSFNTALEKVSRPLSVPPIHRSRSLATPQPRQARIATPTFASLSSPANLPPLSSVPESPELDSLIRNAVAGKKRKLEYETKDPRRKKPVLAINLHSQPNSFSSQSSSDSRNLVEQQLTQSINIEGIYADDDHNNVLDKEHQNLYGTFELQQTVAPQESPNHLYSGEIWGFPASSTSGLDSLTREHFHDSEPSTSSSSLHLALHTLTHTPSHSELQPQALAEQTGMLPSVPDDSQFSQLNPLSPKSLMSPAVPLVSPSVAVNTPVAKQQAWYGVSPHLIHSASKERRKPETAHVKGVQPSGSKNVFRSGTLQMSSVPGYQATELEHSPGVERAADGGLIHRHFHHHHPPESLHRDHHSHSPSPLLQPQLTMQQYETQDNYEWSPQSNPLSDDTLSQEFTYPPLQTQAPYHSQDSMSY